MTGAWGCVRTPATAALVAAAATIADAATAAAAADARAAAEAGEEGGLRRWGMMVGHRS